MLKRLLTVVIALSLLTSTVFVADVKASTPYEAYNYNYYDDAVHSPAAFVPDRVITGLDVGAGPLLDPSDIAIDSKGNLYIADTGNKRVLVVNTDLKLVEEIKSYTTETGRYELQSPVGLFVDDDDLLYVADSVNNQVIGFDEAFEVRISIENPQSDLIPADFVFSPNKIVVDHAKRIYVVANRMFEGIMQFDAGGEFLGYVGTNTVRRNYSEIIWRLLSTEAQRQQMVLFIPTEFSNIDMGDRGFIYATNIDINSSIPIKRLNPSGEDVLKRYGYFDVAGDIYFRRTVGPSRFMDIKFIGDGIYSALDITQGRVFTYDDEGNLLYVFGTSGNQVGTFRTPIAVEFDGENHYVLDRGKGNIVKFKPTQFGSLVNEASRLHYRGYSAEAVPVWQKVLELNTNYDIAYIGIGRSLLLQKENEEAMHYFEKGIYRDQYSVAFKRFRRDQMKEYFGVVMSGIVVLGILTLLYVIWRKFGHHWRRKSTVTKSEGGQSYEG